MHCLGVVKPHDDRLHQSMFLGCYYAGIHVTAVVFNLWATEVFCSGPQSILVWKNCIYTMSCLFPDIVRKLAKSCGEWRVDLFFFEIDWKYIENGVLWSKDLFFFGDHLFAAGKTVWILVKTYFFGDHLILKEKPPQSNSRLTKIWVKFVYWCFKLPKKPPTPLRNPGYATAQASWKLQLSNTLRGGPWKIVKMKMGLG